MLTVKNVTKAFGDIKALENVSFEVGRGEFVFLMGPSGAGKTTLLRLILGEVKPDAGDIIFDGKSVNSLSKNEISGFRQKIGTVFQDFKVLPERTVKENIEVALAVVGSREEEWEARVSQVLKLVGLGERASLFPAQLSGGEIQRLSLARALVVNPKLILADEPTGNLDWETAEAIVDLFEAVNKEGKTVVMATHNKMVVDKLKKRIIYMKDGKIVTAQEPKEEHKKIKLKVEEV